MSAYTPQTTLHYIVTNRAGKGLFFIGCIHSVAYQAQSNT